MFDTLVSRNAAEAIAMRVGRQALTYQRMAQDIGRCANWLGGLGLKPGSRVLLCVPDPYAHWILTFGLETLGATSCAVSGAAGLAGAVDYLGADMVLTSSPPGQTLPVPAHPIDRAWLNQLPDHSTRPPTPDRSPDDILRIIVTSGTTGQPKKIAHTRRIIETRLRNIHSAGYYQRPDLRMASTFPFSAVGGWNCVLDCLFEGGTLMTGMPWAEMLSEGGANVVRLAPAHLKGLIADLPPGFTPSQDLRISIIGGSLSAKIAMLTAERLTEDVLITYGSTETGSVAMGLLSEMDRPDAAGFVRPWARIEALDPDGTPVPPGQTGEIRVWSDNLCDGYLDAPAASAAMFRDGWFWTGDLGQLSAEGRLVIVGRTNDLMNIGGAKMLATRIEALALTFPGIDDAAAFPFPGPDGMAIPHLAYVSDGDPDLEALTSKLTGALGQAPVLLEVAAIPRNGMGKIQRELLAGLV